MILIEILFLILTIIEKKHPVTFVYSFY